MTGQSSFSVAVSKWVAETQERITAVLRESAEDVIEEMQRVGPSKKNPTGDGGHMPVDTGYLRASLVLSKDQPTPINPDGQPVEGQKYTYTPATMIIQNMKIGETIFACYTANYAHVQEYGTDKFEGRAFVRMAAQKWPMIVEANCNKLQAMATNNEL